MDEHGLGHVPRAALITTAFGAGFAFFAFGAKVRWVDGLTTGEDAIYWVLGIVVHFFTGIAAAQARSTMSDWLVGHPIVFRFWLASTALATVLFGGAIFGVSVLGLASAFSGRHFFVSSSLILLGLLLVAWGFSEGRAVFRPVRETVRRRSAL